MAGLSNTGDPRFPSSPPEVSLKQLLNDAHSRWLKPAEICEILNSHRTLALSEASPVQPTSGSLFLFDRNKLRYFRKDGHNWRKKKDGKTVREAHEKLKAGNKDAIHCYYAHGEDNPNFQRRSYWLLEGGYENIVLVHYREVTEGNRFEASPTTFEDNTGQCYEPTNMMYGNTSPSDMVSASYISQEGGVDIDSGDEFGDNYMTRERRPQVYQPSILEIFSTELGLDSAACPDYIPHLAVSGGSTSSSRATSDVSQFQRAASQDSYGHGSYNNDLEEASPWSTLLESTFTAGPNSTNWIGPSQLQQSTNEKNLQFTTATYHDNLTSRETGVYTGQGAGTVDEPWSFNNMENQPKAGYAADLQSVKQVFRAKSGVHHGPNDSVSDSLKVKQEVQTINSVPLSPTMSLIMQSIQSDSVNSVSSTWIDGSLVGPSDDILSSSQKPWGDAIRNHFSVSEASRLLEQINSSPAPDLQGLLFSIVDFAPQWSYAFEETKVLVTGGFLDPLKNHSNTRWSFMFGEIEVPAEVLQSGAMRCTAPPCKPGRVPFYVTCSNRISCSNIEEFEFRNKSSVSPRNLEADTHVKQQELAILNQARLAEFLLSREDRAFAEEASHDPETAQKQNDKLDLLLVDETFWNQIDTLVRGSQHPFEDATAMIVQAFFKSALHQWLQRRRLHGKGVSLLDKHGLGVLHRVAALGYEWAIAPILAAGVGVNFRDERGWTALHWAAFCGREKAIALLLAADAAPGALTDPTPNDPTGRTASDLAASSGHNGIAGYLGEAIVTSHLSSLNLHGSEMNKVSVAVAGDQAIEVMSVKSTVVDANLYTSEDALSLRDSLAAVRNAAQAEARITATFRAYSFQKKRELEDSSLNEFGMLEEEARAFASAQTALRAYPGHEKSNLAATQIQCKYRGWKVRNDFLSLKKQVVKIQAHVRGHQARKKYKKILWTVGVLDKVILRWRRKGSGLRGFKAECIENEDSDDDAYLKDFRKQKEAAFGEAVSRVKQMIKNPEARSQYRRMLEIYQKEKGAQLEEDFIIPDDELMALLG